MKFGHQRDYDIYSRLILAANQADIGLTAQDAADRALFFIVAWTAENRKLTDAEFQAWAWAYKPFYAEFTALLETVVVRRHLMRYFRDVECSQAALEDLTQSSRFDENVVKATMARPREVARETAASACIVGGSDPDGLVQYDPSARRRAARRWTAEPGRRWPCSRVRTGGRAGAGQRRLLSLPVRLWQNPAAARRGPQSRTAPEPSHPARRLRRQPGALDPQPAAVAQHPGQALPWL